MVIFKRKKCKIPCCLAIFPVFILLGQNFKRTLTLWHDLGPIKNYDSVGCCTGVCCGLFLGTRFWKKKKKRLSAADKGHIEKAELRQSHCARPGGAATERFWLIMLLLIMATVSFANMFISIGVVSLPLSDQGPHIAHGWGQVVRLRHLYAARPGLHLLITGEGQIQSSADQTLYSKSRILKQSKQPQTVRLVHKSQ